MHHAWNFKLSLMYELVSARQMLVKDKSTHSKNKVLKTKMNLCFVEQVSARLLVCYHYRHDQQPLNQALNDCLLLFFALIHGDFSTLHH